MLCGAGGLLGAATLPFRSALAGQVVSGHDLKFIFVMNYGGWDPTRVFTDESWNGMVDVERSAEAVDLGDLTWVAHADRPSVDRFFSRHHDRTLILNGLQVPGAAHDSCLRLMLTGSTSTEHSDWPSIVGRTCRGDYALPHIVISGPAYPGPATRTGSSGQLEGMLDGTIIDWSKLQTGRPSTSAEDIIDRYLSRRLAAIAEPHPSAALRERASSYLTAQERASDLEDLASVLDWSGGAELASQITVATDALSMGISRCAMLSSNYGWDTHTRNDETQSSNFESLFSNLAVLMDRLAATPGTSTDLLIDETMVVVLSEMGRAPQLNASDGKDHWPHTSAMLVGPRITGGRVIGGFDSSYRGVRIDRETGERDDDGHDLNVEELGATLLLAAGIDPNDHLTGVQGISGIISG